MKHISIILSLFLIQAALLAVLPRGMTTAELDERGEISTQAKRIYPEYHRTHVQSKDWYPITSEESPVIINSRQQYGLRYNALAASTELYHSQGTQTAEMYQALQKVPLWIRAELQNTLLQLTQEKQLLYSNLILTSNDPYIDEIAFAIAHSSKVYLNSSYASPQLFSENATAIYQNDQHLPYVQVMDYGNSTSDPNYYSTTRYTRKNAAGETELAEVPPEIYYWYLVHPKITDEIPAYIDPSITENNSYHYNNIAAPPSGVFWRSWFFTVAEDEYPQMQGLLSQCTSLFNRDGTTGDAIRTLQGWINSTMSFGSGSERPHQPVRIYRKHLGRCGEYQDYTAAAAKTALIPCTSIASISTDHVWNEFWEDGWVQWEPVNGYIDSPLVYENGWGKVFGSVFEWRPDGFFTPVTDRYSEGSSLIRIRVLDDNGLPVDGARVILAILDTTPRTDTVGFTGIDGWVEFIVGEGRDFRARCETSWGIYPAIAGTYAALTPNSVNGEVYSYEFTIEQPMPQPVYTTIPAPVDNIEDWRLNINFTSPAYYLNGRSTWDDISPLGEYPEFYKRINTPGKAASLILNSDDLLFLQLDLMASIFINGIPVTEGAYVFDVPIETGDWYMLLDNSHSSANAILVDAQLNSYSTTMDGSDDHLPSIFPSLSACPNPFTQSLSYTIKNLSSQPSQLAVYNMRGQLVRELPAIDEGSWDTRDSRGTLCAPGIYFLKLHGEHGETSKKLLLVR